MSHQPVLTIAIPTYNMDQCLDKNLATYRDSALKERLEVLCLNNASVDNSKNIIEAYAHNCPEIFTFVNRPSRGYGGSINQAMDQARGTYFRIVDADDWVDTSELIRLVDDLESCTADIVLTDYQIVNMATRETTPVRAGEQGIKYGKVFTEFAGPIQTLPSIHGTTYRTGFLRECGFRMQDEMFFVDEEYVVLPYLAAKTVVYYPFDIYRYQVANPAQSTSPKNRAKYQTHREKVLKRLICEYQRTENIEPSNPALSYCFERIRRGVGDHFTTLYMYVEDRKEGRCLAKAWQNWLKTQAGMFWLPAKQKAAILHVANSLHLSLPHYQRLKDFYWGQK